MKRRPMSGSHSRRVFRKTANRSLSANMIPRGAGNRGSTRL